MIEKTGNIVYVPTIYQRFDKEKNKILIKKYIIMCWFFFPMLHFFLFYKNQIKYTNVNNTEQKI